MTTKHLFNLGIMLNKCNYESSWNLDANFRRTLMEMASWIMESLLQLQFTCNELKMTNISAELFCSLIKMGAAILKLMS